MTLIKEVPETVEDVQREQRTRVLERSDEQKLVDGMTGTLKQRWEAAGKPEFKPDTGTYKRVQVAADEKREVKKMITRSGTLHKVGIVMFNDAKQPDGTFFVKWSVTSPPERKPAAQASNGQTETAAPEGEQNTPAPEGEQEQTPAGRRRGFGR